MVLSVAAMHAAARAATSAKHSSTPHEQHALSPRRAILALPSRRCTAPASVTVEGELVQYQQEKDGAYRLVILDSSGNTVVARIPNAARINAKNPYRLQVVSVRKRFYANFHPSTKATQSHERIRVGLVSADGTKKPTDSGWVVQMESFGAANGAAKQQQQAY
jgi:hypothetical protein